MNKFKLLLTLFVFTFLRVNAQEIQLDELIQMDLEELLTVEIVSGSIMKQSVENSPVIIDILNKNQISDFNADDLYELLSYLPGIEMVETYFGRTVLNFRGVKNFNYTNKSLLTVNGKPMFEPVNGSFFLEMIPINAIERIEVIRGQGGTLLGTNAYSGVINIVTAKGSEENAKLNLATAYGSYNTVSTDLNTSYKFGEKTGLYVAASLKNGDGYPFKVNADEGNNSGTIDYKNNYWNAFLNFSYDDLSLDVGYMSMQKTKFGITPNLNYSGLTDYNMFFASAGYKSSVSAVLDINYSAKFNRYNSPDGDIGYFPVMGFGDHDTSKVYLKLGGYTLQAEIQSDYEISGSLSNVSGIVYESAKSDKYQFLWETDDAVNPFSAYLSEYDSYTFSVYTQFEYKPFSNFQAVAGIRAVKDEQLKDVFFSPRLGLIYSINNKYYFKALYGQGFRLPNFFEKYVSTYNVLFGSDNLKPERTDNFDLVFEGVFDNIKTRLNGYLSFIKNDITRAATPHPDLHGAKSAIYINDPDKYLIYGIEYSFSTTFDNGTYAGLNFGWKTGENLETEDELLYSSNVNASGWITYKLSTDLSLTPYLQFIGARDGKYAGASYSLDSYLLANLNIKYAFQPFVINLTLNNILDQEYSYPEYIRAKIADIPGGRGRNTIVQVSYEL